MQDASRRLNKIDEFQYPREILKLSVEMYNGKEIGKRELLKSYMNLIDMQTEIGNFKAAKKTLKHLKLFSLNSWNPSDVLKALEIEGYGRTRMVIDIHGWTRKVMERQMNDIACHGKT